MQVKNNYDILWREDGGGAPRRGGSRREGAPPPPPARRGGVGITVDFEGRIVEYSPDMLGSWSLPMPSRSTRPRAAEYRAVILVALDGAPMLLTRGVLYTAITRSHRSLFIVVGRRRGGPHGG